MHSVIFKPVSRFDGEGTYFIGYRICSGHKLTIAFIEREINSNIHVAVIHFISVFSECQTNLGKAAFFQFFIPG